MKFNSSNCFDWENNIIPVGSQYSPSSDACQSCTCGENGIPTQCLSVLCKPPQCHYKKIERRCCTYECQGGVDLHIGLRVTTIVISLCFLVVICLILLHMRRQRQRFKRLLSQQHAFIQPPLPLLPHASLDFSSETNGPPVWNVSVLPPYSPPSPKTTPPPPYTPIKEMNVSISQAYASPSFGQPELNNNLAFMTREGNGSHSDRTSFISADLELSESLLSHHNEQADNSLPTTSH